MIGQTVNNQYKIIECIGSGGMANVYRVQDVSNGAVFAIKMLKDEFRSNAEFLRRFENEANAVLSLSHKNIVRAYSVGTFQDLPYIVMEYVPGKTLKELIVQRGPFPQKKAVELCIQILSALSYAHNAGFIHRDVKPQNIIVTPSGIAKLTDFGIARDVQATTVTFAGSNILGSAHYLSPEQAKGLNVTIASDLYSTGVLLYELLTGSVPFNADSTVSVALKHVNEIPEEPIKRNPEIYPSLNSIVIKALDKLPEKRFQSAKEMISALNHALKNHNYLVSSDEEVSDSEINLNFSNKLKKKFFRVSSWTVLITILAVIVLFIAVFLGIKSTFSTINRSDYTVPNFIGKSLSDAITKAEKYGFSIKVEEYAVSDTVDYGLIISQSPDPGKKGLLNSEIIVTVSIGKDLPGVPSLIGKTVEEATALLSESGLSIGRISYQISDVAIGYICWQNPPEGAEAKYGSSVDISVSATKVSQSDMPYLIDLQLSDAVHLLNEYGFTHILVNYDGHEDEHRTVVVQSPSGGDTVQLNNTVLLSVSGSVTYPFTSDVAYNLNIESSGTEVMITIEENVDDILIERILYKNTFEKGEKIPLSIVADAESGGIHELILYINGIETRRQDIHFEMRA